MDRRKLEKQKKHCEISILSFFTESIKNKFCISSFPFCIRFCLQNLKLLQLYLKLESKATFGKGNSKTVALLCILKLSDTCSASPMTYLTKLEVLNHRGLFFASIILSCNFIIEIVCILARYNCYP